MRPAALLALVLVTSAGCGGDARRGPAAAASPGPAAAAGSAAPGGPRLGAFPGEGVPHSAAIDVIELAPDGRAALTRDMAGGWRVWAALDGSAQPQVVPVRGAREGALARDHQGRLLMAFIDSAGGLRLLRTDRAGRPGRPVAVTADGGGGTYLQVRVLPGGARAVAVRDDHVIELRGARGELLATLERRGFRPSVLAVATAPDRLVAVAVEPGQADHDLAIHRVDIAPGAGGAAPQLRLGPPMRLTAAAALGSGQLSLAPGGGLLAFPALRAGAPHWQVEVVDLAAGTSRSIELAAPPAEKVALGFVDDGTLLVTASRSMKSSRIELGARDRVLPHIAPSSHFGSAAAGACAPGVRLASVGTWLFVEKVGAGAIYLGYDAFQPLAGAVSPSGRFAAWAAGPSGVFVREIGGARPARAHIPAGEPNLQVTRVGFLDDELLVLVGSTGGVHLVDWTTGAEIDAIDLAGIVGDLEVDPARGLVRAVRSTGETWILRASRERGFTGPFIVADGSTRSGLLSGGAALWTFDSGGRYRTYRLAEIERGMARGADGPGIALAVPHAVDRRGGLYQTAVGDRTTLLHRVSGPRAAGPGATFELPVGPLSAVVPAPDARHVAILQTNAVWLFRSGGGRPLWSRAWPSHLHGVSFSHGGELLSIAGPLGAAVVEVESGEPVHLTCGPLFQVRRTAPPNPFALLQRPNLCEAHLADGAK